MGEDAVIVFIFLPLKIYAVVFFLCALDGVRGEKKYLAKARIAELFQHFILTEGVDESERLVQYGGGDVRLQHLYERNSHRQCRHFTKASAYTLSGT